MQEAVASPRTASGLFCLPSKGSSVLLKSQQSACPPPLWVLSKFALLPKTDKGHRGEAFQTEMRSGNF